MYLPQFTTRNLFFIVAGAGFLFFFLNRATAGYDWAIGISVALASLLALFFCFSVLFFLVWLIRLLVPRTRIQPQNPFAGTRPPDQILPPVNPD